MNHLRWISASWLHRLYVLGLLIGGLLFFSSLYAGFQEIGRSMLHVSYVPMLILAWSLVMLSAALQIMAWLYLMQGLGSCLPWPQAVAGYFISFLPRYIPGSVWGYVSRSQWLYQTQHISYAASSLGSFLELLVGVSTASLVVLVYGLATLDEPLRFLLAGLLLVLLLLIWLVLRQASPQKLVRKLIASRVGETISFKMSLRRWFAVIGAYLVLWSCYGASLSLLARAYDIQAENIFTATFVFGVSWIAGLLVIFVPAGLGVREYALSSLMVIYLGLGVSQASAVAVMSRLVVSLCEIVWIVIGVIVGRLNNRARLESGTTQR